ncbi:MAG: hypothetical protein WA003_04900 [Desulfuromonadaceae bacterium]
MSKFDETVFSHAVTIAAAFVANGDIRCGGNTNENTTAMAQLGDLLPTLYKVIYEARGNAEMIV